MPNYTQQFSPYLHVVHNGLIGANRRYKTYFAVKLPTGYKVTDFVRQNDTGDSHVFEIKISNAVGSTHVANTAEFTSTNAIVAMNATFTKAGTDPSMDEWFVDSKPYVIVKIADPMDANYPRKTKIRYSDAEKEGTGGLWP